MAQPGLAVGYPELVIAIAEQLGWSVASADWTAAEAATIERILKSGVRQYLNPPAIELDGQKYVHTWSFLAPKSLSLSVIANDSEYDLPDDFGGMSGRSLTFSGTTLYAPVHIFDEEQVRAQASMLSSLTGRPQIAGIRPKPFVRTTGQQWEIVFYPKPDASYTLVGRYLVLQDAISLANPYPPGGAAHAEGYIASVKAAAEVLEDKEYGPMFRRFMQVLESNVEHDLRNNVPDFLGYNGDGSELSWNRFDTTTVSWT
jgi:hypothetical protein